MKEQHLKLQLSFQFRVGSLVVMLSPLDTSSRLITVVCFFPTLFFIKLFLTTLGVQMGVAKNTALLFFLGTTLHCEKKIKR